MAENTKKVTEIEEIETDEETTQNMTRAFESDILGGLLAAAGYKENEDEIIPIQIVRNGTIVLEFRIHPLSEDDYQRCREQHTKYVRNKQLGIKVPEDTDTVAYRNALIYAATVQEDRERIWDNKEAWRKLDCLRGYELVGKVLKPGEKDAVIDKLDEISGYKGVLEEVAKN